jgi:transposase
VIVTAMINGKLRILAVLDNREKATIKKFFKSIPKRLRKSVKAICSDLYVGFINAAKEVFGKKIRIIADRFHVAKLYRGSIDTLRKKEMKRLKKELSEQEYKKLNNAMWILRKSPEELTEDELKTLKLLFKYSPDIKLVYELSCDLTNIFNMNINQGLAKRRIKGWIRRVQHSGLTCFDTFIKTLFTRMQEITNYFVDRLSSGFVEGINNKLKVIKRRCYGITNIRSLFQRIRLDLEWRELLN